MKDMKIRVETTKVAVREDYRPNIESKRIQYVVPKINVALTTYYKGTALEGVLSKLEEYLDTTDESESEINYL